MQFDLVFEGGGAKGAVFVGALQEFEAMEAFGQGSRGKKETYFSVVDLPAKQPLRPQARRVRGDHIEGLGGSDEHGSLRMTGSNGEGETPSHAAHDPLRESGR